MNIREHWDLYALNSNLGLSNLGFFSKLHVGTAHCSSGDGAAIILNVRVRRMTLKHQTLFHATGQLRISWYLILISVFLCYILLLYNGSFLISIPVAWSSSKNNFDPFFLQGFIRPGFKSLKEKNIRRPAGSLAKITLRVGPIFWFFSFDPGKMDIIQGAFTTLIKTLNSTDSTWITGWTKKTLVVGWNWRQEIERLV